MITNKTIYIAHNWSDASVSLQSKALAEFFSADNRVIFLNAKKNGFNNVSVNKNLLVLEWPGKRPTGWRDLLFAFKLMRRQRPDMIITNFAANDIMLFVAWLFRVQYRVCYFHTMVEQYIADYGNLPLRQRVNIFRKSLVFRLATHMLPLTVASKKDLLKYYRVKAHRAYIFPNALPDTTIRNTNNNLQVGFLGRLDHSKGVDILIRAFKLVVQKIPAAQLIITGKGVKEQELRALVHECQLSDHVLFNGTVSYAAVLQFASSVNCLVVPSRTDNLPTVALEALSVGTPVIGSRSGGIPDIIEHGVNGLLFEKENHEELARCIIDMLSDRVKRDVICKGARLAFENRYAMNGLRQRFEHMLGC